MDVIEGPNSMKQKQGLHLMPANDAKRLGLTAASLGVSGGSAVRKLKAARRAACRATNQTRRALDELKSQLASTSAVWNRGQLRRGTRLDPQANKRQCVRTSGRYHPNSWTALGTVRLAFSRISALTPDASSLNETRRPLDGIAAVALAARDYQSQALRTWCSLAFFGSFI